MSPLFAFIMWSFAENRDRNRIEITFSGGYDREHDAFDAQLMASATRLKAVSGSFDCLVDMTEAQLAPQAVTERGAGAIQWCIANGLRKGAIVHSSATGRMQMRRLAQGHEKLDYFASVKAAESWLAR